MAALRSPPRRAGLTIGVLAVAIVCCLVQTAKAADVTIRVVQIRATQGVGAKQFDKKLPAALKQKLNSLPFQKFVLVGRFSGGADYGKLSNINLANGFRLRATPAREGRRISLSADLWKRNGLLLRTRILVAPGGTGFIMCPVANTTTILAVSAK